MFATCQPIHDLFLVNSYIILHNISVITFFVQFPNIVLHVHVITKPFSLRTMLQFWCNYYSIITIGLIVNTIFLHKTTLLPYITSFPVSIGLFVVWFLKVSVPVFVVTV
jgi:hypothetical protein